MITDKLREEIRELYESAEAQTHKIPDFDYSVNTTRVIFYHNALLVITLDPFPDEEFQCMVIDILEEKLDQAFGMLDPEEYEQVFRLSEELREWQSQHIPSAKKAR